MLGLSRTLQIPLPISVQRQGHLRPYAKGSPRLERFITITVSTLIRTSSSTSLCICINISSDDQLTMRYNQSVFASQKHARPWSNDSVINGIFIPSQRKLLWRRKIQLSSRYVSDPSRKNVVFPGIVTSKAEPIITSIIFSLLCSRVPVLFYPLYHSHLLLRPQLWHRCKPLQLPVPKSKRLITMDIDMPHCHATSIPLLQSVASWNQTTIVSLSLSAWPCDTRSTESRTCERMTSALCGLFNVEKIGDGCVSFFRLFFLNHWKKSLRYFTWTFLTHALEPVLSSCMDSTSWTRSKETSRMSCPSLRMSTLTLVSFLAEVRWKW